MGLLFVIRILMQKKINLHNYGIQLLNPCKTVVNQINSCGTNELEKYKKHFVQRHIFVQGTLAIDQNHSPALPQR